MKKSIATISYTLSFIVLLSSAPHAWGAPSEQTRSVGQSANKAGSTNKNGTLGNTVTTRSRPQEDSDLLGTTLPPQPLDPVQKEIADSNTTKNEKKGFPLGNFRIYPELYTTFMYDDNIYSSRSNTVSDNIFIISPEILIKPTFSRDSLEMGVGGSFSRYQKHSSEDTNDGWGYIKGRIDLTRLTNVYANVRLSRDHEDRSSSDSNELSQTNALQSPVIYQNLSSSLGLYHRFTDALYIRIGTSITKLNYEDTPIVGSAISYSNNYRNRKEMLTGGRLTFQASKKMDVFTQILIDNRKYDHTDIAFNHNSNGYNAALGIKIKPIDSLTAEAYLGYIHQDYEESQFDNVSAVDYNLNIKYKMTKKTTLSLLLYRSLEETIIANASGYLDTALILQAKHDLSHKLSFNTALIRQWSKYNDYYRLDIYSGINLGAKYYLSKVIYSALNYQYRQRQSTAGYAEYRNNIFYLTLGTDF